MLKIKKSCELCAMRSLICFLSSLIFSFTASAQTKVKLSDLKEHIGDSIMVEGPVKAVRYAEGVDQSFTFITMGNPNNSLTVIITNETRNQFTVKPEDAFRNKSIRVSGRLANNNDKMQMLITDPTQIVVLDKK